MDVEAMLPSFSYEVSSAVLKRYAIGPGGVHTPATLTPVLEHGMKSANRPV